MVKDRIIEFDIHGIVGIKFINPIEEDIREFKNQFCINESHLIREPDIIIKFTDHISATNLNLLSTDYAGYNEDEFFIFSSSTDNAKAIFPFDQIGATVNIVCENGFGIIPHLIEIINLTFISKKFIPVHGTGIQYNNRGIVACGWENGGKTEALLSFSSRGAYYVADDWVILSEDGNKMFGIPVPVFIWEWMIKYIPNISRLIPLETMIVFKSVHFFKALYSILNRGFLKKFFAFKIVAKAMPMIDRLLKVKIQPDKLFQGKMKDSSTVDITLLFISWDKSGIEVKTCEAEEIANRMLNSNEYELSNFNQYYSSFKFAFPERKNKFIDNIEELQLNLMLNALKGKRAYIVYHPYPFDFNLLFDQLKPLIEN